MLISDPDGTNNRKTKEEGWVPGRSIRRPTRRAWSRPKVVTSGLHSSQKQIFGLIASMWALVDPAGIAAWQAAVPSFTDKAPPGVKVPSSAFQLYMYVNLCKQYLGSPVVLLPPTAIDVPLVGITDFGIISETDYRLEFTPSFVPAGWSLVIRCSPTLSPGVSYSVNSLYILQVVPPGSVSPLFGSFLGNAAVGPAQAGGKKIISAMLANSSTGQLSNVVTAADVL